MSNKIHFSLRGGGKLAFDVREILRGYKGDDGVSPEVSVEEIDGGYRVIITDKDGEHSFDLLNGVDGHTPVKGIDYVDGEDGYTPVKGVDYRDGQDWVPTTQELESIADDAASKLQPTITELSQNVDNATLDITAIKLKDTEQDGRITALEERPEPKNVDVQINGTSIVQDGVANIPKASKNGETGVVSIGENWKGLMFNGGDLCITPAGEANIRNRNGGSMPICASSTLDYAIKAALTDGKGAAYTDAEKAVACQRLGAVPTYGYEKILDITTQEDADALRMSFGCNLRSMYLTYQTVADSASANVSTDLFATQQGVNGGTVNSRIAYRAFHSKTLSTIFVYASNLGDGLPSFSQSAIVAVGMYNTWYSGAPAMNLSNDPRNINTGTSGFNGLYGNFKVPSGTRVIVWGVKA